MSRRTLAARLWGITGHKRALDHDLEQEIRTHIELQTEENLEAGMPPEEARRSALLAFGNTTVFKEISVSLWTLPALESLLEDFRYSMRMLRKTPGFTLAAMIVLAIGIGGNTAVFSITYANIVRRLPVSHPEQLANITFSDPTNDYALSIPLYEDLTKRQQSFTELMAWHTEELALMEGARARLVHTALVSGNTFTLLGVSPYLGRMFTAEDDRRGGGPDGLVAVLSYSFWKTHFHGDSRILGQTLPLETTSCKVVGIAPPGFDGLYVGEHTEVILPLSARYTLHTYPVTADDVTYTVIGRLKPDVTLAMARAEIESIGPSVVRDNDANRLLSIGYLSNFRLRVAPGGTKSPFLLDISKPLGLLQALVAIILFICCANVAGLFAARVLSRQQELVTRRALGASKTRIVRQLVIETVLLCAGGAVLGVIAAEWIAPLLAHALLPGPNETRNHLPLSIDTAPVITVLLINIAVTVATALLVAIGPVLRAGKWKLAVGAQPGGPRNIKGHNAWIVPTQVAFSALVLVAAGIAAATVYRLLNIDPGYDTHSVLAVQTDFHLRPEKDAESVVLYESILERLRHMPGIEAASLSAVPLLGGWDTITRTGSILPDGTLRTEKTLHINQVGAEYFRTLGTRLLAGREFLISDKSLPLQNCILSRSAAAFFFPQGGALGSTMKSFATGGIRDSCRIIGIVEDVRHDSLRDTDLRMIYWTFSDHVPLLRQKRLVLVLRTNDAAMATASVRSIVSEIAPGAPQLEPVAMNDQLRLSIRRERVNAWMAGAFGALALLLTAVGLYGTVRYQVGQRTREIAVRMAIGANRASMLRMVLNHALGMTLVGVLAGTAVSFATARVAASLLNSLKFEPLAIGGAAAVLLVVALAASYFPARRATKIDPMLALRSE